ncbi:MAG: efflux RND transporter permease subunit [Campylobacterota bacterium]
MSITKFSIEKSVVTAVFAIMLLIYGIISFFELPRAKDPGFTVRTATVVTYFPGASAKRVEQLVTDKLEKSIQQMPQIDNITSTSKNGVSIIFVNILEKYQNMREIWDTLRRKVQKGSRNLPKTASSPIVNDEFGDVYGTMLAVTSDGLDYGQLENVAKDTKDILLRLQDVAKIKLLGVQPKRVYINFDSSQLAKLNISASYLKDVLQQKNIVYSGGEIKVDKSKLSIEPTGNFENIQQIKNTIIPLETGEFVYLKDISNIELGYENPSSYLVRKNGNESILLAISMKDDGDIIRLGEQTNKQLKQIKSKLPLGIKIEKVFNEPKIVEDIVGNFVNNLLQAMGLVILIMLFSLGFRTGLIVAVLIPMSVLASFIVMKTFDIWLDQVSLAALIISLGLLVDSAIVMSESIMVLMQKGRDVTKASIESANELKIPLLTSALTTSAAFLPIFLAQSTTGEYTNSIFKVVTITLLCSWGLALTLTPVLSKYFMKKKKKDTQNHFIVNAYESFLKFILIHRFKSLVFILIIFVSSFKLMEYIPKIFFPPSTQKTFTVEIRLPIGTSIDTTKQSVKEIEEYIKQSYMKKDKKVESFVSFIGKSAPRFWLAYNQELASVEYATILVNTKKYEYLDEIRKDIENYANKRFPDMQASAKALGNGPPVKKPIEIRVSGKNIDKLFEISSQIKQKLSSINGVKNIVDDWGVKTKKLVVDIDEANALKLQITNLDIALSLQSAMSGYKVTTFRKDDDLIPMVLRLNETSRDDIDRLKSISVYSQKTGENVPLSQVASIKVAYEESKIIRRDRQKTITVAANVSQNANALEVFEKITPYMQELETSFPLGYYYEFGGEYEASGKANESIMKNVPLTFMIIIILLVAQFNSIKKPLIILLTIPLGVIGVFIGLYVTNSYFGFMTLLGIISLSGIVINNAIVLLERIELEKDRANSHYEGLLNACISRFRPIMLTTFTTIFGLIPLWYSGGVMWEPMAVSIIFGLMFATILTLGFVPILYAIMYKVKISRNKIDGKR